MLVAEIINSCSNAKVAEAAVASIGGDFAGDLRRIAQARGLCVGVYTASAVRQFAKEAQEADWNAMAMAIRGKDFPVLAGLRFIIGRCMAGDVGKTKPVFPKGKQSWTEGNLANRDPSALVFPCGWR